MTQMFCTGPVSIYIGLGPLDVPVIPDPEGPFRPGPGVDGASVSSNIFAEEEERKLRILGVLGIPVFLGTCERVPLIRLEQHWQPFIRDDGGLSVPYELIYDSEEAWVYAEINRYNEPVLKAVQDRCFQIGGPALRGFDREEDVGTLARTEGVAYPLWLSFPYAGKLSYGRAGMPPNYVFPQVVAFGPEEMSLGHRPRKNRLVWRALRHHDDNGDSLLYAHDPFTALPAPI